MDRIRLGRSELLVSRICLGCMSFGDPAWRSWVKSDAESRPFFARALERGINFFDTADMYSNGVSEEVTGRALRALARRDEVVIATKVYYALEPGLVRAGLSRRHIMSAIDDSLRRLGTDYVDLYQIHRFDHETPIEETLEALADVVKAGKVRYLGASSMAAWQFATMLHTADRHGWPRFVSMQNHYNLVYREEEREMLPLCLHEGIGVVPWSPLARGFLSGSRKRGQRDASAREVQDAFAHRLYYTEADYEIVDRTVAVAAELGISPSQVALAWLLKQPGVAAPIVGTTKLSHLDDAVEASSVALSAEHCRLLEERYQPHPVLGID
ncbi:MAG: aldo/keto reductase [Acidobacteria bacterium]|jgi:aryl-alcohol dehydrogenase-like predicted oxidoreductase|nr:aldo/keto reductase [Acidobacteriota bacterium]